jgi:hypothetical protein
MTLPVRSITRGRTDWLPGPALRELSELLTKMGWLVVRFWQKVQVVLGFAWRADLTAGRLK